MVEVGPDGLGWDFTAPREWVKKWGPALLITLKVLHVVAAAGKVLGVPIPSLPSSESLGLGGGNDQDAFLKQFMANSWDYIASQCTVDGALNKSKDILKSSL